MNEYIFYTTEGQTLAPNVDYAIEDCQVLGFAKENNIPAVHIPFGIANK